MEEVGQCVDDYDDGDGTGWKITRSGLRKTGELRNQPARSKYMSFEYFVILFSHGQGFLLGINRTVCFCTPFVNTNNKSYIVGRQLTTQGCSVNIFAKDC